MPNSIWVPNAARISPMRATAASTARVLSSIPNSSVPFNLNVSKPAWRSFSMPAMTSSGRSPPTQLYVFMRSRTRPPSNS